MMIKIHPFRYTNKKGTPYRIPLLFLIGFDQERLAPLAVLSIRPTTELATAKPRKIWTIGSARRSPTGVRMPPISVVKPVMNSAMLFSPFFRRYTVSLCFTLNTTDIISSDKTIIPNNAKIGSLIIVVIMFINGIANWYSIDSIIYLLSKP